jgi:hypothetical protein
MAAAVQLYSRLWLELEALFDQLQAGADARTGVCPLPIEVIRLELIVLLDRCDSTRWRALVEAPLLAALHRDLEALLAALAAPPDALGAVQIIGAQNQLFDALLTLHAAQLGTPAKFQPNPASPWMVSFAHNARSPALAAATAAPP